MKRKIRMIAQSIGIAALILIGITGMVGTYAWNAHKAEQKNDLQSRNIGVNIAEVFPANYITPGGTRTKEVSFENTGTAAVFLRVAVSERWETAGEIVLGADMPAKSIHADWELKPDGWYYYKKVLPKGAATANIISAVTFPANCPAGAGYLLDFLVEVVQASGEDAVNRAATQTVFGREGFISSGMAIASGAVVGGNVTWI